MPINKVVYGNTTLIDISDATVTPEDVYEGLYFYDRTGRKRQGNVQEATATVSGTVLTLTDGFPVLFINSNS